MKSSTFLEVSTSKTNSHVQTCVGLYKVRIVIFDQLTYDYNGNAKLTQLQSYLFSP